jgi:hypothetical protein
MVKIPHTLKFETELDETHPIAQRLLSLSLEDQVTMLEGMLKALVAPKLTEILDELNENNSYALLKFVE